MILHHHLLLLVQPDMVRPGYAVVKTLLPVRRSTDVEATLPIATLRAGGTTSGPAGSSTALLAE